MLDFSLIDETFDINNTENYELSIQFFLNGFSFCIFDKIRQKFIFLERNTFNDNDLIISELENNKYFKYNYKTIKILIESEKSTLLPEGLFSDENINKIYKFNFGDKSKNETIIYNKLKTAQVYNIFTINNLLLNKIKLIFNKYNIYHQLSPFIESNLKQHKNKLQKPKLFINSCNNFFDIIIIQNNEIILSNSYKYTNIEDFVFYVMYIYDQLKLNPEEIETEISGIIDIKTELYKFLKKYIKKVIIPKRPKDFTYSYTFNQVKQQEFYNLFNLILCE